MSKSLISIACPHCRRAYEIRIDVERLMRVRTKAVCSRCKNRFDIASLVQQGEAAKPEVEPEILDGGSKSIPTPPAREVVRQRAPEPAVTTSASESQETATITAPGPSAAPTLPTTSEQPVARTPTPLPQVNLRTPTPAAAPVAPREPPPGLSPRPSAPAIAIVPVPESDASADVLLQEENLEDLLLRDDVREGDEEVAPPKQPSWVELADPGLGGMSTSRSESSVALEALLGAGRSA